MRVGNDHHTRGDGTGSHDYCETVDVKGIANLLKILLRLAFCGGFRVECAFSVFCREVSGWQ